MYYILYIIYYVISNIQYLICLLILILINLCGLRKDAMGWFLGCLLDKLRNF